MKKKQKLVKVLNFGVKDLTDRNVIKILKEDRIKYEVTIAESLFIRAYVKYCKQELKDKMMVKLVKFNMPIKKDARDYIINNGLIINNKKFIPYIATPSQQKFQSKSEKCEMWFIPKSNRKFITFFEDLISLGKFKTKFKDSEEEFPIAKMITSRVSLAMSNSFKLDDLKPRIIVIPDEVNKYKHTGNYEYVQTKEKEIDGEIVAIPVMENGKPKLVREDNKIEEYTSHDGMGLMTLEFANRIKEAMGLEYDVYWAIIRGYMGLAIKGAVTSMDFVGYAEKYNNGNTKVLDVWGKEQDIRNCDLLLTESQVKWWSLFGSMEEVNKLLNSHPQRDLIDCLYVTKVNKDPKELTNKTLTNYQLISNLSLDYDNLKKLASKTENFYREVCFASSIDTLKVFLKHFATHQEQEEAEETENTYENTIRPSTKAEMLLTMNKDLHNIKTVRSAMKNLVEKKIKGLASGKYLVNGRYMLMQQCPFTLLNNALDIQARAGELQDKEFFINGWEDKDLVLQRCPQNSFDEMIKITTTTNDLYKEFLSHLGAEVIIFNAKGNDLEVMSGADLDGDICIVVDEPIIYDNVIETDSHFKDKLTKKPVPQKYTKENKFNSILDNSGNMIGALAIQGCTLSNKSLKKGTKEAIKESFLENKAWNYWLLQLQRISIDCPKTGQKVHEEQLKVLEKIEAPRPYFMKYNDMLKEGKEYKTKLYEGKYDDVSHSPMDRYAELVCNNLLKYIWGIKGVDKKTKEDFKILSLNDSRDKLFRRVDISAYEIDDEEKLEECKEELKKFITYRDERTQEIKTAKEKECRPFNEQTDKLKQQISKSYKKIDTIEEILEDDALFEHVLSQIDIDNMVWEKYDEENDIKSLKKEIRVVKEKLAPICQKYNDEFFMLDIDLTEKALKIEEQYPSYYIAQALKDGYEQEVIGENGDVEIKHRNYSERFSLSYFFNTIKKHLVRDDECYALFPVLKQNDKFDFEELDQKYIKVKAMMEDDDLQERKLIDSKLKATRKGLIEKGKTYTIDALFYSGIEQNEKLVGELNIKRKGDIDPDCESKYANTAVLCDEEGNEIARAMMDTTLDRNLYLVDVNRIKILSKDKVCPRSVQKVAIEIIE